LASAASRRLSSRDANRAAFSSSVNSALDGFVGDVGVVDAFGAFFAARPNGANSDGSPFVTPFSFSLLLVLLVSSSCCACTSAQVFRRSL
jgi:hypothetical protein